MIELPPELLTDPAHESYFPTAQSMAAEGKLMEAAMVLIRALDSNPGLDRGRLLLGRLFFELGAPRYAAREVKELVARNPNLKSLSRLREALEPGVMLDTQSLTRKFAETQFKSSEIDALQNSVKSDG